MRHQNKNVLITGAAGGIGRATALAFAREGARLVLVDIQDACMETANLCKAAGAEVTPLLLNVADRDAPDMMMETVTDRYGQLDIAVNNAGIVGNNVDITDYEDAVWDEVMDINVRAVFRAMKAQINNMRQQKSGCIINTASVASLNAMKLSCGYIAAKHALMGLTKAAALDVIDDGIRINAVCPGIIDTPLIEHGKKIPGFLESLQSSVPAGRLGKPEEVAATIMFLASDDAGYIMGQGVVIDGGVTLV